MAARSKKTFTRDAETVEAAERTLIGVLASNDDERPNLSLVKLFTYIHENPKYKALIDNNFHFLITGGTWDRIFCGQKTPAVRPLTRPVSTWLRASATPLPGSTDGGVIILSNLVTQQRCSIIWPFFSPSGSHWLRPENLALLRLSDQWRVKRLMNRGSVMAWLDCEAQYDVNRNRQPLPPMLTLARIGESTPFPFKPRQDGDIVEVATPLPAWKRRKLQFANMTIALIAHNEMKQKMIEFAIDHESELAKFKTILATGTTGREVMSATTDRIHARIRRCHSGPEGGDIEIATAILYDRCHVVIFFIDPLHPHPHIEDIRVVFQACMVRDQVIMITNEVHARDFMSRVVRERKDIEYYG